MLQPNGPKRTWPATLQGLRVLVVEDELLLAMYVEERLREAGCGVIGPAARVESALALLERERPDAALLDLNLNGVLPVAVADALLARDIPFVIVSGYPERLLEQPALRQAPRLAKPFRSGELMQILSETVDAARGRRAALLRAELAAAKA